MNYVTAENLTKTFGVKTLFENISFSINEGDKIALVAKNGSGKTTLLKILMGTEPADSGEVFISKDIRVVLFEQKIDFEPESTVEEFMMSLESPAIRALRTYHKALASGDAKLMEAALSEMEIQKAWDLENEIRQFLFQLQITDLTAKMKTLSGGQVKRVALAKLLTETRAEHRHTLLILDEPTNHLDVEMVEWLEQYLSMQRITLLLVTHDRYFLDKICDVIWEIEDHRLYVHRGSYATYLENKAIREENQASEVSKARNLYRRELEWMRRQPQARGTKAKGRINAFYDTEKVAKQDLRKDELTLDFEMKRLGKKILELKDISKSFGDKVLFRKFSYQFQRGEKVGVVGPNGAGKTTLLNIVQGLEPADGGEIETGETISFGYFSQKGLQTDENQRVIDFLKEKAENYPLANGKVLTAAQFLHLFLFDDVTQYAPIYKLSGGEKRRLHLLYILYQNPNFLIFDEPTNDLDLPTLTILEDFLRNFSGCILMVSHDRYFMDKIVDHILVFKGEGVIKDFVGNFTELREKQRIEKELEKQLTEKQESVKPKEQEKPRNTNRLSYKEKRELEQIEKQMPELEEKRGAMVKQLSDETDYEVIAKISEELERLQETLDELEMRWFELQEKID